MKCNSTRREWLVKSASAITGAYFAGPAIMRAAQAPTAPVAVARCRTYTSAEVLASLERMFDQLGGLGRLVKNKTVAMKVNLTGATTYRLGHHPVEDSHYTHPAVIAATAHLMSKAGARRIRIVESPWSSSDPVEETLYQVNWEPRDIISAGQNVEFYNTNYIGKAKKYSRLVVPFGGYIFPAFDLSHAYEDCDVFASITKGKEHATAGITLALKNSFGLTPSTIYGSGAGVDEPALIPKGGRQLVHSGDRQPSKSAPPERDPTTPRQPGYRVPRTIVDLNAARPVHLAIVDMIRTMTGGEGPWVREAQTLVSPGLLFAGTNAVTTDAVGMSIMGYDPMADRGTPPFEGCDSTLRLAEDAGLGTRDLKRIEVLGLSIQEARFDFAAIRKARRAAKGAPQQG